MTRPSWQYAAIGEPAAAAAPATTHVRVVLHLLTCLQQVESQGTADLCACFGRRRRCSVAPFGVRRGAGCATGMGTLTRRADGRCALCPRGQVRARRAWCRLPTAAVRGLNAGFDGSARTLADQDVDDGAGTTRSPPIWTCPRKRRRRPEPRVRVEGRAPLGPVVRGERWPSLIDRSIRVRRRWLVGSSVTCGRTSR